MGFSRDLLYGTIQVSWHISVVTLSNACWKVIKQWQLCVLLFFLSNPVITKNYVTYRWAQRHSLSNFSLIEHIVPKKQLSEHRIINFAYYLMQIHGSSHEFQQPEQIRPLAARIDWYVAAEKCQHGWHLQSFRIYVAKLNVFWSSCLEEPKESGEIISVGGHMAHEIWAKRINTVL